MLTAFTIRNYKSILDLRVDFGFVGRAPAGWRQAERLPFLQIGPKTTDRLAPVLALYGANASGKSTVVEAFLSFVLLLQRGIGGRFHPNKLNRKYAETTFEAELALEGGHYRYAIAYDGTQIGRESLTRADGSPLYMIEGERRDFAGIVSGAYDATRFEEVLRVECTQEGRLVKPLLVRLATNFPGLNPELPAVVRDILGDLVLVATSNNIAPIAPVYTEDGEPRIDGVSLVEVVRLLRQFDFGLKTLRLDPLALSASGTSGARETFYEPALRAIHEDTEGNEVIFNFLQEESEGTKRIFRLLLVCLRVLARGGLAVFDELDESIHPLVMVTLVRLFTSRRYNKKNARLLFTVHDTILLEDDVLRATEVGVVSKTLRGGTQLTRLCDFEGQPSVGDFRKDYLRGVFGGIPFPYI